MINSRFGKRLIYFLAIAVAVLFVAGLLQTSFFPALGLLGVIPDLVLILVCGVAFYLGAIDGAVIGLAGGIVLEGLGGYGVALAPLFYLVMGVLFGALSRKIFRGNFVHVMLYSALYCLVKAVYSIVYIAVVSDTGLSGAALGASVLPEFLLTWLLAIALTVPVRGLSGVLRGRKSLKKGKGGLSDL